MYTTAILHLEFDFRCKIFYFCQVHRTYQTWKRKKLYHCSSNFIAAARRSKFRNINMEAERFFQGILLLSFLAAADETGSTGNALVTCAACQTAQVKFDSLGLQR